MRIAVYVRVSTQRQVQSQTIEQQLARLRTHIEAQGWVLLDEHIFRDDGYSGSTLKRPGLDRLRDRADTAAFDRIVVTAPDRLARKYVHQVLLIEELERKGAHVDFLDRPMSEDPHDQLLLQIRGAVAEYERSLIVERMRRGRLLKYQQGTLLPWTRAPYGYRLHPDHPRDPNGVRLDAAEAAIVTEIFAFYLQANVGLMKVAKHLYEQGVPSPAANPVGDSQPYVVYSPILPIQDKCLRAACAIGRPRFVVPPPTPSAGHMIQQRSHRVKNGFPSSKCLPW